METKYKCGNCEEEEVEHKGEWCSSCDLPDCYDLIGETKGGYIEDTKGYNHYEIERGEDKNV